MGPQIRSVEMPTTDKDVENSTTKGHEITADQIAYAHELAAQVRRNWATAKQPAQ